jgi:DNA invertase Pin-like site-specific DNA recombinase
MSVTYLSTITRVNKSGELKTYQGHYTYSRTTNRTVFTPDDIKEVINLHTLGVPKASIARKYNCTSCRITRLLLKHQKINDVV